MQNLLGKLSEGVNVLAFAGIALVALACAPLPAMAQDSGDGSGGAGTHEALSGIFLNEVAPNGDLLYQNTDDVLKSVPALLQRHYAAHVCFVNKDYPGPGTIPDGYDAVGGNSLNDLLPKYLGTDLDHILLMRVERSYVGDDNACGLLELTYAYKNDIPAPALTPAKKK